MENEKDTYLGKAIIQTMVATILLFCAVSHTSMTWTIILGFAGLVWAASAHQNFNKYERRG
jgi:apolipoprotein N-acyltransferase